MEAPESGHSVLTVGDLLGLEELLRREVSWPPARHRLGNRVEWVHVFETPFVAGVIAGASSCSRRASAWRGCGRRGRGAGRQLARAGAAGIGFEPTHALAATLVEPCRRHELPLLVFGRRRAVRRDHPRRPRAAGVVGAGDAARAGRLQAQLREAAREGLGPEAGPGCRRWGEVREAQVLLEARPHRTPISESPRRRGGRSLLSWRRFRPAHRQRLADALHSLAGCMSGGAQAARAVPQRR
jgi:hypothetical protein